MRIETRAEKIAPVVGRNLIKSGNQLFERVRLNYRIMAGTAQKDAAEIIQRFLILGLPADDYIGFQPEQHAFGIEIGAAAVGAPFPRREIKDLGGIGSVLQRSPVASCTVVQHGSNSSQIVPRLLVCPQAAASRED